MFDSVVMFEGTIFEKGYGQIARAVMRDKDLKIQSKSIYAYICSFASNSNSGERTAFPSIELQCAELGISENTYYTHRKPLIEKGYLKIRKQNKNNGQYENNVYVICMIPIPAEPKDLEEAIPQNLRDGENVDLEPFEPYPKNCGMDEPYLNSSCMENPRMENCGTKTTSTKTTKTKKELVSSSSMPMQDLIEESLKTQYPNAPFEEIKATLLSDETITIETAKQYHAMLEYRLKNYKPRKRTETAQFKPKRPVRTEHTPDWFTTAENEPESEDLLIESMNEKNMAIFKKLLGEEQ